MVPSLESRFATRWYASGDRHVVVGAADDALMLRAEPQAQANDVAAAVEQAWIQLAEKDQAKALPAIAELARPLDQKGLFRVQMTAKLSSASRVALAQALLAQRPIIQVYPVLQRGAGQAYAAQNLILRAAPGQLEAMLGKALPLLDATLLRRSRIADTALIAVGERFAQDAIEASRWLAEHPGLLGAVVAEPDIYRTLRPKAVVNDPMFAQQWHLDRVDDSVPGEGSIKVQGAWDVTKGDPQVVIAVVDTGTDMNHPDLVDNIVGGFDASADDEDPEAECSSSYDGAGEAASCPANKPYRESHGTSVCGTSAGRGDNNLGTSGVCPLCSLMPVRLLGDETTSGLSTAETFVRAVDDGAWVINNSWGPGVSYFFPLTETERGALHYARTQGRGGRGTLIVFAAGNESSDVGSDSYARDADVMGIAASSNLDDWSYYSNYGAEIDVAAPSSAGATDRDSYGIVCADYAGGEGYAAGDYTTDFGGTSAASPVVAGLAGLILSANPKLTADQVRVILTSTAEKIRADKIDWVNVIGQDLETVFDYDDNGHSIGFGWGRVDATRAVAKALAPSMQGALCSETPLCPSCDDDGRCQLRCKYQEDCPDGTVCQDLLCVNPRPAPTDIGELCSEDCAYCVAGVDNDYNEIELCSDFCVDDTQCPSGFDCRLITAGGAKLCAVGSKEAGEPAGPRNCYDDFVQGRVLVSGEDGQTYCADMCLADGPGACPYGFHCSNATYTCTQQYGSYCFEYSLEESTPMQSDWYFPSCFPDPGFGMYCQTDDDCKLGDYCNAGGYCQIDDRQGCQACDSCETDADCGPRGHCTDAGGEQRCAIACDTDGSCPGDSLCREVSLRRGTAKYCLSPVGGSGELWCQEDWSCSVPCRDDVPCGAGLECVAGDCVTPEPDPQPVVDAGGSADGGGNEVAGGCNCSTAAGSGAGTPSLLLWSLMGMGLVLRRRQTHR